MKAFNTVMKVLAALVTVAGVVYVVATYGDKLVAWAKKLLKRSAPECECECEDCDCEGCEECETCECECGCQEAAEAEEEATEETVTAEETDFVG